jgi:NAD(P)H-hydrate epimerase
MPVPVISVAQMREWEKATWIIGRTEAEVIGQVAEIIGRRAHALTRVGDGVLILAGKGHNGDDARMAQAHLPEREVQVLTVEDPAAALRELAALLEQGPALLVDGLFGIGLNRPLSPAWVEFIQAVNESEVPVLAVDLPSGLNADTGEPFGAAIRAALTVTLGAPKRGLLRASAVPFVGRLEVAPEIGLVPCPLTDEWQWTLPEDFVDFPPARPAAGHKGTFGHLAIVAGSLGYHGAAVLAARGAQRAQPGLITLYPQENVYTPVAAQLQAVMVRPWRTVFQPPETCTAILIGPGLASPDVPMNFKAELVQVWQEATVPVIVDASALDWLPPGPTRPKALRVITPHPGEAARMLQTTPANVQADRPATVRELSQRYGDCWVVLKGHETVIANGGSEIFFNSSGNPHLAQGGSGDVLAGYLAGLLAQPALQREPLTTLRFAVWQHGATADALGERQPNWTVENLAAALGTVRARPVG